MRCLQLPYRFDPERLRQDLARIPAEAWVPHFNTQHYDGRWSGVALRAPGGAGGRIVPDALGGSDEFADTPWLAACPYFREVLAVFRCPLRSARLLNLHAGSSIREHVDNALEYDEGEVRLHVPIETNDAVAFYLEGKRVPMAAGECWYTNVNLPHRVDNHGATDRVHLVIDCAVDPWLRRLFESLPPPERDFYGARLRLPAGAPAALPGLFGDCAGALGRSVQLRSGSRSLALRWPGRPPWEFRLRWDAPASAAEPLLGRLESSPDPERRHLADYELLLQRLREAFPGSEIAAEALP